jgi:hypothetical protein
MAFPMVLFEQVANDGGQINISSNGWGALYESGRYLITEGNRISLLLDFLANGPITRLDSSDVPVLAGRYSANTIDPSWDNLSETDIGRARSTLELLMSDELRAGRFDDMQRQTWRCTRLENSVGARAVLLEEPHAEASRPIDLDPNLWEVRFKTGFEVAWADGTPFRMLTVSRRVGEGTRRIRWVQDQLREMDGRSLFVSAGNAVEGRSWLENTPLNLHRPRSWMAAEMAPLSLLVPAQDELAGGLQNLLDEAETAGVHLVSANLLSPEGEPLLDASVTIELGGVDIAFVGLTNPDILAALPPEAAADLTVADPTDTLDATVRALRTREGGAPDLIVLMTLLEPAELDQLLMRVSGVDIVIGESWGTGVRDMEREIRVYPGSAPGEIAFRDRSPLLVADVHRWQVGRLDGYVSGRTLTALRQTSLAIDQTWPTIVEILMLVDEVRHAVYLPWERLLFPEIDRFIRDDAAVLEVYQRHAQLGRSGFTAEEAMETFPVIFSDGVWLNYMANAVRARTNTDVALVRTTRMPYQLTGPIPEVFVHAALQGLDEIVVYDLDGATLSDLLDVRGTLAGAPDSIGSDTPPPAVSGADWANGLVGGRALDSAASYLVATTDHLASLPGYAEVLAGFEPASRFVMDADGVLIDDSDGDPVALHRLIIDDLGRRASANPELDESYWTAISPMLADQGAKPIPVLFIRIPNVGFSLSSVSREGALEGFDTVRNSRINQADSTTLTTAASLAATLDTEGLITTLASSMVFGELNIDGETTETQDDLVVSLDFQARFLEVDVARSLLPYVTSTYDTELTPNENDDGTELPRQSELRESLGVVIDFGEAVPEVRIGGFLETDFAADVGASVAGIELKLAENLMLGSVGQSLNLSASYFFASDEDTAEDLEFTVEAVLAVDVPLFGNLALTTYLDTLLFRGKLPGNDSLGMSLILGVGLSYSDVFRIRL